MAESDPARTDVACFIGLARCTGASLPGSIVTWLKSRGWVNGPYARPLSPIADVPVPIDQFDTFALLFDAGGSEAAFGTDYLAAAVRTFFAQGGRRCYVIRMDDPVTPQDDRDARLRKLSLLLPRSDYAVDDRRNWHGVGHLGGLPDVSILAMPDLPVLTASDVEPGKGKLPVKPAARAQFVECAASSIIPPGLRAFSQPAPRLKPADYDIWTSAVDSVLAFLARSGMSELQFAAAIPLPWEPDAISGAETSFASAADVHDVIDDWLPSFAGDLARPYRLLQLSYPWLRSTGSHVLLEGLEPPDGALAGILARNALARGSFADAVKIVPSTIYDVFPAVPAREAATPDAAPNWTDGSAKPLIVRACLFGFTPGGLRLLSDVTAYPGENYRPGRVPRLVAVVSRACRRLGEQTVFANNGAAVWSRLQTSLRQLMTRLWRLNALEGATTQDAFSVRCDRSTMTQNDIDNGRLVAQVTFTAAATIELIRVTLAVDTSGGAAKGPVLLPEAS